MTKIKSKSECQERNLFFYEKGIEDGKKQTLEKLYDVLELESYIKTKLDERIKIT